jgi:hypothetical protein
MTAWKVVTLLAGGVFTFGSGIVLIATNGFGYLILLIFGAFLLLLGVSIIVTALYQGTASSSRKRPVGETEGRITPVR